MNSVNQRLDDIKNQAERILDLFINGQYVPKEKLDEAQESFRKLKELLTTEYKKMSTLKGQAELSEEESRFYKPAIHHALYNTNLSSIKWNTVPSSKWHFALAEVRDYMTYYRIEE